jgi:hypothetical protein
MLKKLYATSQTKGESLGNGPNYLVPTHWT